MLQCDSIIRGGTEKQELATVKRLHCIEILRKYIDQSYTVHRALWCVAVVKYR